ncbi:hypothetical protein WH47_05996 [Habropoda laboriosa]|uniref:Protein quiver n=1 Tax=Habropoda laboriosa TaxID=597456 RepID=A0A0L7RED4_9HYME|nr:hypothetical protein WH47_05996 [Habropoda laboriosa]
MKKVIYYVLNLMEVLGFKCIVLHQHYVEKELFILNLKVTSVITVVERDCAPQKRIVPIYSNNKWQNREEIVTTAYKEGCFIGEDKGAPAGPPEYCFCSYHLCNSSQSIETMNVYHICLLIMILLFVT